MIEIGVCEDEAGEREALRDRIVEGMRLLREECRVHCCSEAAQFWESEKDFDIVFMDIRMPGEDGMETVRRLRRMGRESLVIFVTGIKELVYDAFELEAFDYLCKPVGEEKLGRVLRRAVDRLREQGKQCLFIQTAKWSRTVRLHDITYCEVIDRKVYLHTGQGVVEYYSRMEELERKLDGRFTRCHRSYMVNLEWVKEYTGGFAVLENGESVPVSRLKGREFIDAMLRYMERREGVQDAANNG